MGLRDVWRQRIAAADYDARTGVRALGSAHWGQI